MTGRFTINGLKRGTVVRPAGRPGEWSGFYGRVIKVLTLSLVVVIDCGKHVTIYHINELEADGYKGRYDRDFFSLSSKQHWLAMPNMRYMKRIGRTYNPNLVPFLSPMVKELLAQDPSLLDGITYQNPGYYD